MIEYSWVVGMSVYGHDNHRIAEQHVVAATMVRKKRWRRHGALVSFYNTEGELIAQFLNPDYVLRGFVA